MKVAHLPTSVGGMAWALAQGEKSLGLDSKVFVGINNWLKYPADEIILDEIRINAFSKIKYGVKALIKALEIANSFDVFHFNMGQTLINYSKYGINNLDLPFYSGKGKIVVTYNGCDARQKYKSMNFYDITMCSNANCSGGICNNHKVEENKRNSIQKFDKYADVIFAVNPDLFNYLPSRTKFLPYAVSGIGTSNEFYYHKAKGPIKIIHSPTNREVKGSHQIIEAVEKVNRRYDRILELELIENISHSEALNKYAEADLIIDQILSGWYGGFAVEVMQMKKPVMAYIREADLKYIPHGMAADVKQAIINTDPNNIYDRLCEIVENQDILNTYSKAGYEYANTYHDPAKVAQITKAAYEE